MVFIVDKKNGNLSDAYRTTFSIIAQTIVIFLYELMYLSNSVLTSSFSTYTGSQRKGLVVGSLIQ